MTAQTVPEKLPLPQLQPMLLLLTTVTMLNILAPFQILSTLEVNVFMGLKSNTAVKPGIYG